MKVIVQKFGGRSLINDELRRAAAAQVKRALNTGQTPVVVVSALGRYGDPYATDTLIQLMRKVHDRPSARSLDLLMSCGEIIAAALFAEELMAGGLVAVALTGWQSGIYTDERHGEAFVDRIDTARLLTEIGAGRIPVVTGFQGLSPSGEVTTLGRGGSDTTAAALGVALEAGWIEIFTDVDGVKTADPAIVPDAGTIAALTYQEVVELAHLGAKVIHPRAVEIAMEKGIPLRIRSVNDSYGGTTIGGRGRSQIKELAAIGDRVVAGIAHMGHRAKVQIDGCADFNASGMALQVFRRLAESDVSVDLIYLSTDRIGFIVDSDKAATTQQVLDRLALKSRVESGYAKVSVVGAGMHGVPGVMARIVACLETIGVPILQTTDSHANISCLIHEEYLSSAVSALHKEFHLS